MALIYPIAGEQLKISSGYGGRVAPTVGASTSHMGVDISVPIGTNVMASGFGTVSYVGSNSARGNFVKINHGNGIETLYQHLKSVNVKAGQAVMGGQSIGLSGNTGVSTGAHLHFEVFKDGKNVNPVTALSDSSALGNTTSGVLSGITGFDTDGITSVLKANWLFIIGGLLVLAVLTK